MDTLKTLNNSPAAVVDAVDIDKILFHGTYDECVNYIKDKGKKNYPNYDIRKVIDRTGAYFDLGILMSWVIK